MVSNSSRSRRAQQALSSLAIVLLLLTLSLSFTTIATPAQAATATAIPDTDVDPYGVNTFLDKEVEPWKKERTMQMINQAGVKWIKQLFAWNEIEFKKGYFNDDKNNKSGWEKYDQIVDLATKYNVQVVARIDQTPAWANPAGGQAGAHPANLQDYADFLKAFAEHYKGKIHYITVWNEPNLEGQWEPGKKVDATSYVQMLKLSYAAIKSVDPTIKVMAAPLAITLEKNINLDELTYLDNMYKAGAKDYFDIMPANAYGLEFPPDAAPDPNTLNYRRVELLHNVMVKNGDTNKAVWFNEYGWNASPETGVDPNTVKWRRVTPQQQADYTTQGIKYAKQNWPWAGVIFIWFFRQVGDMPDTDSEQYFQMVKQDFSTQPVYNAVKTDAFAFLQQAGQPTPAPLTLAGPDFGSPTAATTSTAGTTSGAAVPTATVKVAAVPKATSTPLGGPVNSASQPAVASSGDSGSLLPIIIGAILVLLAGGGLVYWGLRRRS